MPRKTSSRHRGNSKKQAAPAKGGSKSKIVKKSLSLTPAAWKAIETKAKAESKGTGLPPNHSLACSTLVCAGAGK